ncbi:MAG: ABC transporter substrate-binding protein [bacterium]
MGVFTFALLLTLSCIKRQESSEGEGALFIGTDDIGHKVVLKDPPHRIICLSPEAGEIIANLGRKDHLIAVVRECDYPNEITHLPKVGSFSSPSFEKILSLSPDLVIATGLEQEDFNQKLIKNFIEVLTLYPRTLDDVMKNIRVLGRITESERRAEEIIKEMEEKFESIKKKLSNIPEGKRTVKVYIEISPDPLMTVAKGSFVNDIIKLSGCHNIGEDLPREYCRIDPELVIKRDPDYIIILHNSASKDDVMKRTGWDLIKAVKNRNIITDINPDLLLRASPRLADGAILLFNRTHPEYSITQR